MCTNYSDDSKKGENHFMKKHQTLAIFLIKDNVKNLKDCLKNPYEGVITPLNPECNMVAPKVGNLYGKNFLDFIQKIILIFQITLQIKASCLLKYKTE